MSALLDHGHPNARGYPLGMMFDESNLVRERLNARIVTDSKLIQMAIGAAISDESLKLFTEKMVELHIETVPRGNLFEV